MYGENVPVVMGETAWKIVLVNTAYRIVLTKWALLLLQLMDAN